MGYQGSEMDNEVKNGEGNSYTTEFRQLDPRLGRWLTLDPVTQPWQSPYCSMDNNPIYYIDPLGLSANGKGKEYKDPKKKAENFAKRHNGYVEETKTGFRVTYDSKGWKSGKGESSADFKARLFKGDSNYKSEKQRNEEAYWRKRFWSIDYNDPCTRHWFAQSRACNVIALKYLELGMDLLGCGEMLSLSYGMSMRSVVTNSVVNTATNEAAVVTTEGVVASGEQTIIGEGMKRVSVEAAKRPGSVILNNMPEFVGTADEVTSEMMTFNRQWILQQMRSGRPILDLGLDATRANRSIFYQMEQNMIRNYLKLHPNAFPIITP